MEKFNKDFQTAKLSLLCLVALLLSGCGNDASVAPTPQPVPQTNTPPTISLPSSKYVNAGDSVVLTAQASDDVGIESLAWTQIEGPSVTVTGTDTNTLNFTAPELENGRELKFRFKATDAQNQTDSGVVSVTVNPLIENSGTLTVSIETVDGINFSDPENQLLIVAGRYVAPINSPSNMSMQVNRLDDNRVTVLSDEKGKSLLMSYDGYSDGVTQLSLESTAIGFVLRDPKFYGLEVTNFEEVSRRVSRHPNFEKLVQSIERRLARNSPCPLKPGCNSTGTRYASTIAQEIDFSDIIKLGE